MNTFEIIFLFFSFQALLLAVLFLLKRKGDKVGNSILSIYLFLFSINISYNVLYWSGYLHTKTFIHFKAIIVICWISYPILIYFYIRRFVNQTKFRFIDVLHLVPILIIITFYFPFFSLNINDKIDVLLNLKLKEYIFNLEYNVWLILAVMIFYVFLSYNLLKKKVLSFNKKRWLFWLLGSFSAYVLLLGTYFILTYFRLIATEHDYIITYALIFFIALVTYFGFVQPDVFNGLSMDKVLRFKKYKKTGLTTDHSLTLKSELIEFMKNNKSYLNSELRLNDLAEEFNLSRHHMSQIINEHFDATFFDFINTYRIEEAKKLFHKKSDLNITEIIYQSGFNNRTSFYKAFKKHTGSTPKMFKQAINN